MLRFKDISIKRKLTGIIMIASSMALLLVSTGFVAYDLLTFRQTMTDDLSTMAELIGNQSTAALTYEDTEVAKEILGALKAKTHIVAAALYDKNGRLLASYSGVQGAKAPFPKVPEQETARFENGALILFHEIRLDGEFAGTIYLKSDLQAISQRFERYAAIVLVLMVASLVATLFLARFLRRVISRPVFHLADIARTVSGGKNYSIRATRYGGDELGQLTDSFNEMLGQIQQRDADLRQAHDKLEVRVAERTQDLSAEIAERKRTEQELTRQFVRLNMLNQITQAVSERQNTESLLHVVLRQLEGHMGLDLGLAALFDSRSQALNVAALRMKDPLLAVQLDLREGSALPLMDAGFHQFERGQTVYFADTATVPAAFTRSLAAAGWRSAVIVPLMIDDKLFGILLSARLKENGFNSGDCEFLRMLSEHVALAAHQERLHTNLENAYNELRQTQAAVLQQERLKALGQMASGIAHDVNNALSPIVGFSEIVLNGDYGLNQEGQKYLKYIRTAGDDIAHIVARLREFYRARESKESLQQININTLAEQVIDMTRPRWRDIPQSKGVTIETKTDLEPDMPKLMGIESEIREALTNLVLNAVDAMPTGGRIAIRTRLFHREVEAGHADQILLEVSDTGMGMSEEIRKRCLEPFFSTKGKRGTGLGLAMVYGVIERHEGSIEIQSEPGKGTTFRLIFPLRASSCESGKTENNAIVEPLQILCIDDEPLLRELIKQILERDGHEVEVTDSGQSGLDEFRIARERGRPFDVVITDLGMPYLDGRQVARVLKQESPTTPVIMLTGWGAFMKEDGNTPEGVDGVISKPPRARELRQALSRFHPAQRKV